VRGLLFGIVLLLAPLSLPAQELKDFEKKVTEFTLPNGLHFTLAERHEAPVVSFHTYVAAGSVDDPSGKTGLAHMFEHMAFKGTETIGTRDWPNERKALDAVEEAYDKLEAERNKGPKTDQARAQYLEFQLKNAIDRAQSYTVADEYTRIIEENGGVGLNASTSPDSTNYYYSLPSNRIELWFLLESQRFLRPVFRQFYKERDVVQEEYRQRIESNIQGRLMQQFRATAFDAHPYRQPPGGWPSDVETLRRGDAQKFFERYYVPGNINIAIVGDVNPTEARRMAEKYFGPMAAKPLPPRVHTKEPPPGGQKNAAVESTAQPLVVIGYQRPDAFDKSDPVFDVIQLILSSGRTGWLYQDLVQEKKIAAGVQALGTYPGGKYPGLFAILAAPSVGHSVEENEKAIDALIQRLKDQKVEAPTLARAKTKLRADTIRRLADNSGLALLLASYQGIYGDWRKLFTSIDDVNKVTAEEVQRVARRYFVESARTTAYVSMPAQAGPRPPAGRTRR
jgi:predicted Zn-dependent peptidase